MATVFNPRLEQDAQTEPSALFSSPTYDPPVEEFSRTFQQVIDDLPEQIALLDEQCTILAVNGAWAEAVSDHGYSELVPVCNYRDFCASQAGKNYEPAIVALAALDEILSGVRDFWQYAYNGRDRWSGHDYQISFHRVRVGSGSFITVTRQDMTELFELRRREHELSASLLASRDAERQRISRELHDSTSQLLTGMGLLVTRLRRDVAGGPAFDICEEIQQLLAETHQEIRSISYLANPPALKQGLPEALRVLVDGFARRTGLEPAFEVQGVPRPIGAETAAALYRIAQEALSNVHRHAQATKFRVLLSFRAKHVHLVINDNGIGLPLEIMAGVGSGGVGLAGMRSRLTEIGGRLRLRNRSPGALIIATVRSGSAIH